MARSRRVAGLLKASAFALSAGAWAVGCAAGTDVPAKREAIASNEEALTPASGTLPNCNDPSTPHTVVQAFRHRRCSGGTGAACYWGRAPTPEVVDQTAHAYEENVWSEIAHSNGYEYLLRLVSTTEPALELRTTQPRYFPTRQFFGVGIEYQPVTGLPANPPYYMEPPAAPVYPTFNVNIPFGPTKADWNTEVGLATGPTWAGPTDGMNPPVNSEFWRCVTVLDEGGTAIDFFVLMDEHDPVGPDW
jgi:hypothetical protein